MKIREFIKKNNLNGSLLEKAEKCEHSIALTIDYCYWQQENYKDEMPEIGIIKLIFNQVEKFEHENYMLNSDEIIDVFFDENECLNIKVYNDISSNYYIWKICAGDVEFIENP